MRAPRLPSFSAIKNLDLRQRDVHRKLMTVPPNGVRRLKFQWPRGLRLFRPVVGRTQPRGSDRFASNNGFHHIGDIQIVYIDCYSRCDTRASRERHDRVEQLLAHVSA